MKDTQFWQEAERRVVENQRLKVGGLPDFLGPLAARGGLEFWKVGLFLSLLVAVGAWLMWFPLIVEAGKWLLRM